jgi:hypothetical protein
MKADLERELGRLVYVAPPTAFYVRWSQDSVCRQDIGRIASRRRIIDLSCKRRPRRGCVSE